MSLRFEVNISILFTELPLLARPAAAAAAGFDTVESWWPFDEAVPDAGDVDDFVAAIDDAGVRLEALNFFGGSSADGDRGVVSIPAKSDQFRQSIPVLTSIAERTGCRRFNALYGARIAGITAQQQDELATENLTLAAEAVDAIGGTVLLEPLTEGENGSYPLKSPADVLAVIDRLRRHGGGRNVRLLADFYHLTNNGFDWRQVIETSASEFGHVQIADAPGRHQPGTGHIDFPGLFAALDEVGYPGYVGIEYRALGSTLDSLSWLPRPARSTAR